jgi:hypothetical protein
MANGSGAVKRREMLQRIFSRENALALGLCLVLILLVILTSSAAPQWIYQGF